MTTPMADRVNPYQVAAAAPAAVQPIEPWDDRRVLSYLMAPEDYEAVYRHVLPALKSMRRNRLPWLLFLMFIGLILVVAGYGTWLDGFQRSPLILFLIVTLLFAFCAWYQTSNFVGTMARKLARQHWAFLGGKWHQDQRAWINEVGYWQESSLTRSCFRWFGIERIERAPEHLIFYIRFDTDTKVDARIGFMPLRAFNSDADVESFLSRAEEFRAAAVNSGAPTGADRRPPSDAAAANTRAPTGTG